MGATRGVDGSHLCRVLAGTDVPTAQGKPMRIGKFSRTSRFNPAGVYRPLASPPP